MTKLTMFRIKQPMFAIYFIRRNMLQKGVVIKMKKEKKESAFSRLMKYAGGYKGYTYTSLVLSAVSAVRSCRKAYLRSRRMKGAL